MLEQLDNPLVITLVVIIAIYSVVLLMLLRRLQGHQKTSREIQERSLAQQKMLHESENEERFISKADEALRLTQTFQKFVPKQFVDHFAKHGSESLELGRADEDEVAILFTDIRGFTGLSERMTPQELMKFLNSYFLRMNDPIHQNGGFIDKFIGDAIMALFDHPEGTNKEKATDALHAAVDLRTALNVYNQHRSNSGYPPVDIGVGIHFGPVIIGTVGSDDRMDTTVIGDSVNVAYRLEALAPKFNADIIVSAQVLETANGKFSHRLLDWVKVKGRTKPVMIFEIIEHLPIAIQQQKLATVELIKRGLDYRIDKDCENALACFRQALEISPDDSLIAHHIEHCNIIRNTKMPEDWDGALSL
jgi:adenylate cyclase